MWWMALVNKGQEKKAKRAENLNSANQAIAKPSFSQKDRNSALMAGPYSEEEDEEDEEERKRKLQSSY